LRSTSWPWRSDPEKDGASACREPTERNSASRRSCLIPVASAKRRGVRGACPSGLYCRHVDIGKLGDGGQPRRPGRPLSTATVIQHWWSGAQAESGQLLAKPALADAEFGAYAPHRPAPPHRPVLQVDLQPGEPELGQARLAAPLHRPRLRGGSAGGAAAARCRRVGATRRTCCSSTRRRKVLGAAPSSPITSSRVHALVTSRSMR
jgi:hypothetical protein